MKKIIMVGIIFLSTINIGYAENDFNKLSKEDQEQCKITELLEGRLFKEIKVKAADNLYFLELYVFDKNQQFDFLTSDLMYLVLEKSKNYKKIIGISRLWLDSHKDGYKKDYEEYNEGYLVNVLDYKKNHKISEANERLLSEAIWSLAKSSDLKFVTLVKEKPKEDISYIKIKNCFVEEYYNKSEKSMINITPNQ